MNKKLEILILAAALCSASFVAPVSAKVGFGADWVRGFDCGLFDADTGEKIVGENWKNALKVGAEWKR